MSAIRIGRLTPFLSSPYLALLLRLLVGATFVFAGVTKLPLHSEFIAIVQNYHLLPDPLATAYALMLPWIELLIGAYLLLGILLKPSAVATILIGISFIIANVSEAIRGEQYCSSCFGEAVPLLVWQALAIDIFIIVAALLLFLYGEVKQLLGFDSWFAHRQCAKTSRSQQAKLQSHLDTRSNHVERFKSDSSK